MLFKKIYLGLYKMLVWVVLLKKINLLTLKFFLSLYIVKHHGVAWALYKLIELKSWYHDLDTSSVHTWQVNKTSYE